jgi:signal transduction histidine kinase/DNA-binding response OmpR family regulator/uncharacterized protein HemY
MQKVYLILFFITNLTFGHFKTEIDSLEFTLKNVKSINEKIKLHDLLINRYFLNDIQKANYHNQQLFELGKKHNNSLAYYKAYYLKAIRLSMQSKKDDALTNLLKANMYAKKLNDFSLIYESTIKIGQVYTNKNNFKQAQFYIKEAIKIAKEKNAFEELSRAYMTLGEFYKNNKAYALALDCYLKTDSIHADHQLDRNFLGENFMHLGQLYYELKLFNQAEKNFTAAKSNFDETKNELGQMHAIYKLGDAYFLKKDYNQALLRYQKAHDFYKKINFIENFSDTNLSIGKVYVEQKKHKIALNHFNTALALQKENNNYQGMANSNIYIGDVYFRLEDYQNAEKHYLQALKLVDYYNINNLKNNLYVKLAKNYSKTKNYSEASKYYDLNELIKDSISILNENQQIFELETKHQTDNKQKEIKLLSTQNELGKKQKYIYISLLGLLVLIGAIIFYAYRNKIKTAQQLNELNELKSRFFANISHEFRTPLTLIKSPVQSLQSEITDENQKNKLRLIDTNSTRMLELVDQLLELSKIDGSYLKLILKDGNISSFLLSVIEPFEFQSEENELNFISNIEKSATNYLFDKDVIEKIVTNLLSNAFKYSSKNETITFTSSEENLNLKLIISNTGSTIKKGELPKLFERFYQKNENNQGVGIGLALVKELVDLYKGTIETTLNNDELSFIVQLPLSKSNTNAEPIPVLNNLVIDENNVTKQIDLPVLLIIDDNVEIRMILREIFEKEFKIFEAKDGLEGIKIAQKEIPDCILSDVMMPNLNGFDVTKQIKNNELTSFIPVVLLTAKSSDEAHLEGLKSTADSYLTKPFNNQIVKETVHQLITERKKLHKRYSQELILRPVDILINSSEEKFIEKLQSVLNKELSNPDFSAEDFANQVNMSRMQLHRKLKSLLGVSATEFIRNERLKISSDLLRKRKGNISDVAYSVGFNDVSYFSKCFKEMYNCSPREYIEKN